MKKIVFIFLLLSSLSFSQVQQASFTSSPTTFNENEQITITVSNVNPANWGVSDLYLWAWSYDINDKNSMDSPNNGSWSNSNENQKLTNNNNGTFSITFTPTTFFNRTNLGKIGMLVKAKDGSGDKKSQDHYFEIGTFQITLQNPTQTTSIINNGDTFTITASSSVAADFNLKANNTSIHSVNNITNYNHTVSISENTSFILEATNNGATQTKTFDVIVKPTVVEAAVPTGMKDGINLHPTDQTKATLVIFAPNKEFIHLIGSFNNWKVDNSYLLKKDSSSHRFWIELSGLTPQENYTYQYLVDGILKIADPYSTTVLTETNDQYIDTTTYPNLPSYPNGKTNHHVTLLKTGETPYQWQTTNFQKPEKTNLVIYELLIRDFDALHSFDAVKNRLDYLQNLGINAIELLPIMEFDGNESWGYNTSFHMALDKYYGNATALKQFIDECHRRGIAVILDIALNHATGQNPYYRMWNTDNGGYGGQASSENPFFNASATHSYSVFNDFNHSSQATKQYVKRVSQFWIEEYKIDGFRWDLTKGFTQNCLGNETCTNAYQQDRVDILKTYADYQWDVDPNFYIIFEHLGSNTEETQWVNYRLNEGKGIMVWGNHNHAYNEATMGYHTNSDFSWISYKNRNWSIPANVSYMESHDEERLMYKNLQFGNSNGSYSIKNTTTALQRQQLAGAFYFTVPGPKMIWQFGELGYDISIDQNGRTGNKPILWNYFDESNRKELYNVWNKLIHLKLKYDIFKTADFTLDVANTNGLKKIHLTKTDATDIKYLTIIGNFGVTTQNIVPNFQQTGIWYDVLNDNTDINVADTTANISLAPGEYKIYANMPATLSNDNVSRNNLNHIQLYPNPASSSFSLTSKCLELELFNTHGKLIKKYNSKQIQNNVFPLNNISKGVYFIKIKNKQQQTHFKKIIIN